MPISKNKTRLAVTLDLQTAQLVEELAKKEQRSGSAMLAILITEALENRKKLNTGGFVRSAEYYKRVSESVDDPV